MYNSDCNFLTFKANYNVCILCAEPGYKGKELSNNASKTCRKDLYNHTHQKQIKSSTA